MPSVAEEDNRQLHRERGRLIDDQKSTEDRSRSWSPAMIVIERSIGRRPSTNQPPEELHHAAPAEIDDDFVVLHAVTALYGAEASQEAIVTIAHPSQSAVLEQAPRMH
jgi:hypothetical protein